MTSFTASAQSYRHATSRRALGYLLLLMIVYGGAVETVHSHGNVRPSHHTSVASFVDAGGSDHNSHTGRSNEIECSMCAFQQQLFNGLVHAPLFMLAPLAQIAFVDSPTVTVPSTSTTRPSGRAPPLG
ncbi:MAG TPA: DUF2946 family protein [Pyrinomonadaceae bacterium]|jgi:hypothetical protein|nr:DUF2946 family protein [Pyrinomonadaceae bacterium]